jgi:archaemetzincin
LRQTGDWMPLRNHTIGVCALGNGVKLPVKVVAAHVSAYLKLTPKILPPLAHPAYAFSENRLQYDAGSILRALENNSFDNCMKVIAVLDVDLFIPIFTRVYGEARQNGKIALVSTFRLSEKNDGFSPGPAKILERTAKVALHELGHLFNLEHCPDTRCLMHYSGNLAELDDTPLDYCRYCATYFRDAFRRS